jgi:hypothetical protein
MNKWKLCTVALVGLLIGSTGFSQLPQSKEGITTPSADRRIFWKFDTGG